jgi:hypothetical protein
LTTNYERAKWVVVARVDSLETFGDRTSMSLTVEEQFKGPDVSSFQFAENRQLSSGLCDHHPEPGEKWLLFLRPRAGGRRASDVARWPGLCSGSLAVETDREVSSERALGYLEALRTFAASGSDAPADPWTFQRRARACLLGKPFNGPHASGYVHVNATGEDLHLDVRFYPRRQPVYPPVDDPRALDLYLEGEIHSLPQRTDLPGVKATYRADVGDDERILEALRRSGSTPLTLSLEGGYVTPVGTFGFAAAAANWDACRN